MKKQQGKTARGDVKWTNKVAKYKTNGRCTESNKG